MADNTAFNRENSPAKSLPSPSANPTPQQLATFQSFFESNYRIIFRSLMIRLRNTSEAEDLTQETFLKAARNYFETENPLSLNWLLTIADNTYNNHVRYHKANKRDAPTKSYDELPQETNGKGPSQEQRIIEKQRLEQLKMKLQTLPLKMRTCFSLHFLQGYKYKEIASLLNIDIQTVKSHISRARKKVVEFID